MRGALQPDLSVTGRSTSRHERPTSGGRRRPPSAARNVNTKANIFGVAPTPRGNFANAGCTDATPEAPRDALLNQNVAVISKSELEETKRKLATNEYKQPVEVAAHSSPSRAGRRSAPVGVPSLQLGNLADDADKLTEPVEHEGPHLHTPDTGRSDISWGTPIQSKREEKQQPSWSYPVRTNATSASHHRRPADMPALDLQDSQEERDLRKAARAMQEEKAAAEARNVQIGDNPAVYKVPRDESKDHWSTQPKSEREWYQQKARQEQEKLFADKKKDLVMETVLVDQLSRAAISDPDAVRTPAFTSHLDARARKQMEFYNTRSSPSSGKSENVLAKRVRFGARIVTKHGHDVHRELNGFFFSADNTLTIYEFRQFGTRSSALPFIQRGLYSHILGSKKGRPYILQDIAVGNSLSFSTANQSSLPQSISAKPVVTLRITDLDEEAKERLLYDDCRNPAERRAVAEKLTQPPTAAEQAEQQLVQQVQGEVRRQLAQRASKTLMGMGRHFRTLDKSGDGMLDKGELINALKTYHIQLSPQVLGGLWNLLDVNGDGALDYGEFVRGFIGEMNETRKAYVRKVFHKFDPSKTGLVELNNMKKFFSAKKHPKVLSGRLKEHEAQQMFLSSFENCEHRGEVTYAEFEDYYEGVSIGIASDEEFVAMMKNCWSC
ncbi:calcyphosin-2 isoform X2 [Nematostella vectensis]|uniref:calcyphosin-2 isoform X2 n=1 Tax=Nematostella vectensis TaxID=45351 RepID=UPI002076E17B|nr:calcyphosin-2 isoform X2 [Nematostella vectensis]